MENTINSQRAGLAQKIAEVSRRLGAIAEDGKNKFSGFSFISSANMLAHNRKLFPEIGMIIIPEITETKEEKIGESSKGSSIIRTIISMKMHLIDIKTGFEIVVDWAGADQDSGGKSFGQAVTEGCKRFYFKLFNVSSLGDKDPDEKTEHSFSPDTVPAGKYKGKKFSELKDSDPEYVAKVLASLSNKDRSPAEDLILKHIKNL